MPCELYRPPQQTAPFGPNEALPAGAHAYAEAYRAASYANGTPLGSFKRDVLQGVRIVAQYTHHTTCNGTPNTCCTAVTLFKDVAPPGTAPGTGVTGPAINWTVVAVSGGVAVAVVAAFWLALRHAGRHDQPRRLR